MSLRDLKRMRELFELALERPSAERSTWLEEVCGNDTDLRAKVEGLIEAHEEAGLAAEGMTAFPDGRGEAARPEFGEAEASPLDELRSGARIGSYELLEEIGEGGFGVVWVAEQQEPITREVALKVIKPGMDTREVIARFEVERQALALMEHPNIAKVLDAGATASGRPYFVMERVRGIPITKYCDQHRLSPRARLELLLPVCRALQHAHQKGVIHRDIKPSNILVASEDGRPTPKVIDFGIAKATGAQTKGGALRTRLHQLVGTPTYMSPEQAEASQPDVDTRSDIYSLGVVLYELLTGYTPFDSERLFRAGYGEVQRTIREVDPPRPSTRLSSLAAKDITQVAERRRIEPRSLCRLLRGDLDWVVMKALAKERERRYETATAMALDLERYLRDEPVEARPPGRIYRTRKLIQRHRLAVISVSAVLCALVAGLAAATYGFMRAREQAEIAEAARVGEKELREVAEAAKAAAEASAKEASREAARARTVIDVLREMLSAADPHSNHVPGYTVRQLLDDFSRDDLWKRFADEPQVEISLRGTVAEAYLGLGDHVEARRHVMRAVELAREHTEEGAREMSVTLSVLARFHHDRGEYGEAKSLLETVLSRLESDSGKESEDSLHARALLADVKRHLAEYPEAEGMAKEVLLARRKLYGEADIKTIAALKVLAAIHVAQSNYNRAETLLSEALQHSQDAFGDEGLRTTSVRSALATLYMEMDRLEDSESLHKQAIGVYRDHLGEDHLSTAEAKGNLSTVYSKQGRNDLAEPVLREVLAAYQRGLGKTHPRTLSVMSNLAVVCKNLGRFEEAEDLWREVLKARVSSLGEGHPDAITTLANLASAMKARRLFREAEPLYEKALRLAEEHLGPEHRLTLLNMNGLATSYVQQGRTSEAQPLLKQAYNAQVRLLGENHRSTVSSLVELAKVEKALGNYDEAERLYLKALDSCRKTFGKEHRTTLVCVVNLANLYAVAGRHGDAEPMFLEGLEISRRTLGVKHPTTLTIRHNLAVLYREQGRSEEVNRLLDADEDAEKNAVWDPPETRLLVARGEFWKYRTAPPEAISWRESDADDSDWISGPAPLGFGTRDVTTPIRRETGGENAVYFRQDFEVDPSDRFEAVKVRLLRIAGAAVFINGKEVIRDNLAPDADSLAFSLKKGGGYWTDHYFVFVLPPDVLRAGRNTIAVEVHRSEAKDALLMFDLALEARLAEPDED